MGTVLPARLLTAGEVPGASRRLSSLHVRLRDGTRIALDLWLPEGLGNRRIGTILEPTRYTRSWQSGSGRIEDDDNYTVADVLNRAGFAFVIADGRGTGASFGSRRGELSEAEVRDFGEIIDWIAAQEFSNGRVGAMGISYPGVLTEHLARLRRPALKAIAPRFSYYDVYGDLCMPNGIYMRSFMRGWSTAMGLADRVPAVMCREAARNGFANCEAYSATLPQPRAVDGPEGAALLRDAQAEHAANVSFPDAVEQGGLLFKDDRNDVVSWHGMSPEGHASELQASAVPYYVQTSWLDRGSAGGALRRFLRQGNSQIVEIGPWSHGMGGYICDTMAGEHGTRALPVEEQMQPLLRFFASHLADGVRREHSVKRLRYYVMGEAAWHESSTWPPQGVGTERLHLRGVGALSAERSVKEEIVAIVSRESQGTGLTGRWGAAWRGGPVSFDRKAQTEGLTFFRSAPLSKDLRLIGNVRCVLELVASRRDGTVFAYLDARSPDGTMHYLSEGALRLIHRRIAAGEGAASGEGAALAPTPRSFARQDAWPVVPGETFRVQFEMQPLAARVAAGWRLQLSLADRDVDNFDRYDQGVSPALTLRTGSVQGSWIELPLLG